jgi:hypothetical protein
VGFHGEDDEVAGSESADAARGKIRERGKLLSPDPVTILDF